MTKKETNRQELSNKAYGKSHKEVIRKSNVTQINGSFDVKKINKSYIEIVPLKKNS